MARKASARARATDRRKRDILRAALRCYAELGYEKTTMADICEASGASIGSVYHHFKSKDQLFAALYLDGIRRTQEVALEALLPERDPERGVVRLVSSYLEWVRANRRLASYLLTLRRAEFMEVVGADLERLNREFRLQVEAWMKPHVESGGLPPLAPDLYLSILTGPSDHFARQWLRGRTRTELDVAAEQLGQAAWAALQHLVPRSTRRRRADL